MVNRQRNAAPPAQAKPKKRIVRGPSKCPTGIRGLDEITGGGLPRGRPSLVCGGAGCGKTLLAMEFLVRGAVDWGEPGVFVAFEETVPELIRNVASLGYDLGDLIARKLLFVDHVEIAHPHEQSGDFNLDGLFVRLKNAVDRVKAKRVVLDTIENLFSGFGNDAIVRSELCRLFHWIKENRLTAVITGERGEGSLTRQGIEEYVSDCVILLDHRVSQQLATRRLRVVKYRGSQHGTDEYPFMIANDGLVVVPATSLLLNQPAPMSFVSSGVPQLDAMLGGKGYYAGSTVLISGGPGTGKSSLAAAFVARACARGARALYFAFEESMRQIQRSMTSINIDLKRWVDRDLLRFHCARPTLHGLETHLTSIHAAINEFNPKVVVVDPITDLAAIGSSREVHGMLTRLIDFLKTKGLTAVLTGLTHPGESLETTAVGISSLIDTWIELRDLEFAAERNRTIFVCKSRGMAHSNQVREFLITSKGIRMVDVCVAKDGILTGSARLAHELHRRGQEAERRRRDSVLHEQIRSRRDVAQARIAALNAELQSQILELEQSFTFESLETARDHDARTAMADIRNRKGSDMPAPKSRNQ